MPVVTEVTPSLWPGWAGLVSVAAALATLLAFNGLGGAVPGRARWAVADPVVGWGLGAGFLTAWGVFTPWGLSGAALAVALAGIVAALLPRARAVVPGRTEILILLSPLLLFIANGGVAHWDDYSHWFVNHAYLVRYDAFPRVDLPPSISAWPVYPHGLPLWSLMVSLLAGRFVEPASTLVNAMLLATLAAMLADVAVRGNPALAPGSRAGRWALAGAAVLLTIPLNPVFHRATMISGIADSASAVALTATGLSLWLFVEELRERGGSPRADALALGAGLAAVAVVCLKQSNAELLILLYLAAALVVLRDRAVPRGEALRRLPALLLPAVIAFLTWRHHLAEAGLGGGFSFQPLDRWRFHLSAEILAGMWRYAVGEWLHSYLMIAAVAVLGLRGLIRMRTPFDRLALLAGTVAGGHVVFLFVCYLGASFSDFEATRAASMWRYTIQGAVFAWAAAVFGLACLSAGLVRWPGGRAALAAGAVAAVIVPALIIAFPRSLARIRDVDSRALGRAVADVLPPGSRLLVIEDGPVDLRTVIIGYELWRPGRDDRGLRLQRLPECGDGQAPACPAAAAESASVGHVLLVRPTEAQARAFGLSDRSGPALLAREGTGWTTLPLGR